jgi:hypothetical protein
MAVFAESYPELTIRKLGAEELISQTHSGGALVNQAVPPQLRDHEKIDCRQNR